jgi:hypothetical protein
MSGEGRSPNSPTKEEYIQEFFMRLPILALVGVAIALQTGV